VATDGACVSGPFLTHITVERGLGVFYAGGYGALTRHEVPEGKVQSLALFVSAHARALLSARAFRNSAQTLFVDSGLFFAANENRKAEFGLPGGCFSCLCGGEGFVMKFRGTWPCACECVRASLLTTRAACAGPCVVYTQNRNKAIWNKVLRPRPRKTQQNQHAGAAAGVH
jgi:hypothetical protein